jgi:hypothetical protein
MHRPVPSGEGPSLALTLLPPTALILVELAAVRAPRIRAILHSVFVAVLVAAIALQASTTCCPGEPWRSGLRWRSARPVP